MSKEIICKKIAEEMKRIAKNVLNGIECTQVLYFNPEAEKVYREEHTDESSYLVNEEGWPIPEICRIEPDRDRFNLIEYLYGWYEVEHEFCQDSDEVRAAMDIENLAGEVLEQIEKEYDRCLKEWADYKKEDTEK